MNKTIIININGIVFHIEEDAYEVLKAYMTDVKRHFAYSADSDEIVGDIENRIAEMFSEKLEEEKKQVVVLKDVEQVTAQMGAVTEFADADEEPLLQPRMEKKLFRDMDDRIIGGVCSGIAHYFDTQVKLIRIVTLLSLFLGGSGLLIYIILWLVMPKAITRADKMAMKGEPLNIQNFKRNFDDEIEGMKKSFSIENQNSFLNGASNLINTLITLIKKVFGGLFRILVKFAGVLIILAGTFALLATVIALLVLLGFWQSDALNVVPFTAINPEYKTPLYFSAFALIIIPITALVLFAIRVLFNRTILTKRGSFVLLILWLTGLVAGIYYGSRLGAEFSEEASFEQTLPLTPYSAYKLELNQGMLLDKQDSLEYDLNSNSQNRNVTIYENRNRNNEPESVRLEIEKSNISRPVLVQEFSSQGLNFKSALKSAQQISYQFSQTDSVLRFDRQTHIPGDILWRGQRVRLKLLIPLNTRLYIDGRLNPYISDYNLRDCQPNDAPDSSFSEWIMSEEGLKCKNDTLYRRNHERNF